MVPGTRIAYNYLKWEDLVMAKKLKATNYVGNKRSKELHVESCTWAKRMSKKNRDPFNSLLAAQGGGYRDGCGHCMPDLLQPDSLPRYRNSGSHAPLPMRTNSFGALVSFN